MHAPGRFRRGRATCFWTHREQPAAMALVQRHGMVEVFGCARMYLGKLPAVANERIFGVTTFELG